MTYASHLSPPQEAAEAIVQILDMLKASSNGSLAAGKIALIGSAGLLLKIYLTPENLCVIIKKCVELHPRIFVRYGGVRLLKELQSGKKVSGVKQSRRAVRNGLARAVFLARDADPALTAPLRTLCQDNGVPVFEGCSKRELGLASGIQVGAAVAALLKD